MKYCHEVSFPKTETETVVVLPKASAPPLLWRLSSAVFYGVSSFMIIVVNKIVLTEYKFPSPYALGIGQMIVTFVVLYIARALKIVRFPVLTKEIPQKIFPLPVFFVGNLICGLVGTQRLSLPMFTVLRRFTILLTLIGEYTILSIHQSTAVIWTVFAMIGGALIAAFDDLSFDSRGYTFVLCNDFFTAANNIYMKKKLESREFGKYGLLFYNALFMIMPLTVLSLCTGDIVNAIQYDGWLNAAFVISFFFSCIMGFILMYSTVLCTAYNSALTTTIVGVLKNIVTTYLGMFVGGDYVFSWTNFVGLNLSIAGSLIYSFLTFLQKDKPLQHVFDSAIQTSIKIDEGKS